MPSRFIVYYFRVLFQQVYMAFCFIERRPRLRETSSYVVVHSTIKPACCEVSAREGVWAGPANPSLLPRPAHQRPAPARSPGRAVSIAPVRQLATKATPFYFGPLDLHKLFCFKLCRLLGRLSCCLLAFDFGRFDCLLFFHVLAER